MYITLSEAKKHCLIDDEFVEDDGYFIHLIETAENAVAKRIDKPLYACVTQEGTLPPTIKHSILLLVGSMYANRESVAPVQMHALPHSFDFLVGLDKHYGFPK